MLEQQATGMPKSWRCGGARIAGVSRQHQRQLDKSPKSAARIACVRSNPAQLLRGALERSFQSEVVIAKMYGRRG